MAFGSWCMVIAPSDGYDISLLEGGKSDRTLAELIQETLFCDRLKWLFEVLSRL